MSVIIFFSICLAVLVAYIQQYFKRKKYPPGPLGLPFAGRKSYSILKFLFPSFFPSMPEKQFNLEMKQKYGNIWSIDVGDKTIIMLASIDAVQDALIKQGKLFSGRPHIDSFNIMSEKRGFLFIDGQLWEANRQMAIRALRELGMGKKIVETLISEEADELIEEIEKNISTPILSPTIFDKTTCNVIAKLIFGERYSYDNPEFEWYLENLKSLSHSNEAHNVMETFSKVLSLKWMKRLFPVVSKFQKNMDEIMKYITNKCLARIKVQEEFSKPSCVFDFFWRYRWLEEPDIPYNERILDVSHSIFEMFFGATDTINNIMSFGCLVLGHNQHLQNDLRKEIQALVENYKLVNMDMRKNCPKILSFIHEINRLYPIDTLLHRRVMSPCVFKGYHIKTNDIVYADLNTIARDPATFDNPDVFNAYRFLDESQTKYIPNDSVLPFGLGKRACIGQSIADMELFFYISKILLRFEISLSEETKRNYNKIIEGYVGLVYAPLDHEVIFDLRV